MSSQIQSLEIGLRNQASSLDLYKEEITLLRDYSKVKVTQTEISFLCHAVQLHEGQLDQADKLVKLILRRHLAAAAAASAWPSDR